MPVSECVALYARAWVEIVDKDIDKSFKTVALYARAWVEMVMQALPEGLVKGRPLRKGVGRNGFITVELWNLAKSPSTQGRG